MMMNFAFWNMKHAAMMATKPDIDMEEAKKVHTRYVFFALKKAHFTVVGRGDKIIFDFLAYLASMEIVMKGFNAFHVLIFAFYCIFMQHFSKVSVKRPLLDTDLTFA